jgi:aryl-alcohol dehydrogenase-like predicted oxidoreductase
MLFSLRGNTLEKRNIGSLQVSVVGLGCNNFGRRVDEAKTKEVVDAAIDAGINFLDTADIYGATKSEEFLGRVLAGRRDKIVLATKFGMEVDDQRKGAKPAYVKQACEDSLQRLATDHIDLYQLHEPDPTVPIADTLDALNDLVKAGKVREIGCSNFSPEQLQEANDISLKTNGARFVSVQNEYSLLKRDPEQGVLQACDKLEIAFIPYFPLFGGLLSGKYRKDQPLPSGTRIEANSPRLESANLDKVEKLIAFAESKGHTILELAFSWILAHKEVASVIAGATSTEQIHANAGAAGWSLSTADLQEIDRVLA